jgi:tetratricopeptide (TPR) repeat protein
MNPTLFKYRLMGLIIVLPILLVLRATGVLPQNSKGWRVGSHDRLQQKEQDEADEEFERLYEKGVAALKAGDNDRAVDCFSRALQIDPDGPGAHINRGVALELRKDYDRALTDYNDGIRLDPENPEGYFNRGVFHAHRQEYDRALADLDGAIQRNGQDSDYYFQRGGVHGARKDWDRAAADFTEAIRLDPKKVEAYIDRGLAYEKKKAYEQAINDYSTALKLDEKNVHACNNLAWVLATCPNPSFRNGKSALEFAEYACRLTEWKDANLFDTLAAAYAELGRFEEAVQWQKKALAAPDAFEDKEEAKKAEHRLNLYEAGKAFQDE